MTIDELVAEDMKLKAYQDDIDKLVAEDIDLLKQETGFTRWAAYSASSSIQGLAQFAEHIGLPVDFDEEEQLYYRDLATVAGDDNPVLSLAGMLAGSTVDLVGGGLAGLGIKGLARISSTFGVSGFNNLLTQGLVGGAVGGLVEPLLTEDDSTVQNVAVGTAFGGVLGGGAMGVSRYLDRKPKSIQPEEPVPAPPPLALPAPAPTTPQGRIEFIPGVEGKPPSKGGVIPLGQDSTGIPPMQGYTQGAPAVGKPAPIGSGASPLPPSAPFSQLDSYNALGEVRKKLIEITNDSSLPARPVVNVAKATIRKINEQVEELSLQIPKIKRGSKAQKALIKKKQKLEEDLKAPKEIVAKADAAKQAKLELTRLDNGSISPLILDLGFNIAKKKPLAKAVEDATPTSPAKTKSKQANVTTADVEPVIPFQRPDVEPTPPPNVRQVEEGVGRQILNRRVEEKGDAGAAKVDVNKALVNQDDIASIPNANTRRTNAQSQPTGQGGRPDEISSAMLRRLAMYQNAEQIGRQHFFQPDDLLDKSFSFKNLEDARVVKEKDIEAEISEGNFKDAGDWLIKTFQNRDTKTLTPVETLVASRIFAVASSNLQNLMPVIRKLSKENLLQTKEAVRLADDLQVTKELMGLMRQLMRIDEANRKNISNSLSAYKLANKFQQKHERDIMKGKIITDLFFGVKCG